MSGHGSIGLPWEMVLGLRRQHPRIYISDCIAPARLVFPACGMILGNIGLYLDVTGVRVRTS